MRARNGRPVSKVRACGARPKAAREALTPIDTAATIYWIYRKYFDLDVKFSAEASHVLEPVNRLKHLAVARASGSCGHKCRQARGAAAEKGEGSGQQARKLSHEARISSAPRLNQPRWTKDFRIVQGALEQS